MEGIDRGIDEAIPALKACHLRWVLSRHDFFDVLGLGLRMGIPVAFPGLTFQLGHFLQSSSASRFTAGRLRVLELEPIRDRPDR